LRGRYALRLCVLNHTSTKADVEQVLSWLEQAEVTPATSIGAVHAAARDRHPDAASVRMERGRIDPPTLRALPLFASLTDEQAQRVARSARLASAVSGEAIVRKWEAARDFYVLASGTAEVRSNGDHLRDLGPGDFFGELAALDWGASFGYPRLATVIATSPVQAVVLSSDALNALMREAPAVAERVRRAVRERLPWS
jgi:cyclic nucleotide-binding protein